MGVIGSKLQQCNNQQFAEGYSPDKCWFHNGYITSQIIGAVREALLMDDISTEEIVWICEYLGVYEGSLFELSLAPKIQYALETAINRWQNNRGVQIDERTERFIITLLGWNDYCYFMGIMSKGGSVQLGVKEKGGRLSFYIKEA